MKGSLRQSTVQELICKNKFLLLFKLLNSLKTRMLDKSTKKKWDRICKIVIRNAGMKQDTLQGF